MARRIDFHAHVLPGSDHGCRDVPMALEQLRQARAAGVELVVGVSHYYAHEESVERFLDRRERSYGKLAAAMEKERPETLPKSHLRLQALVR